MHSQPLLSKRVESLKPSPTLGMAARAKKMKQEGFPVISLSAGEPDFDTPCVIKKAAEKALEEGYTKYLPTPGLPRLRQLVAEKLNHENQIATAPEEILITTGAKQALYNAFMALLNPGDEVLVFAPYWPTYAEQISLAGGVLKVVHTHFKNGFIPEVEDLQQHLTPRTKMILLNSPSNPTGAVYPKEVLEKIGMFAVENALWIVTDEMYEALVYQQKHYSIASLGSEIAQQTITIGGCSKTFAMTGWRIGFAHGPKLLISAMSNVQDQVTSHATSFAQFGACEAYSLGKEFIEPMRKEYEDRRNKMIAGLQDIPRIQSFVPQGAFYVFPNISMFLGGRFATDIELAEGLLQEAHVATIPGTFFQSPGHLRLSYATSLEDIHLGLDRIRNFLLNQI